MMPLSTESGEHLVVQKKKRNHWVPQSYLRAFAADAEKREKIWTLSKNDGDPELKPIRKVAVRFYLYAPDQGGARDYSFEDKLAHLEQLFAHEAWANASSGFVDLSDEWTRKGIALLTAVMHLRNPLQLHFHQKLHAQIVEQYSRLPALPDRFEIRGKSYELDKSSWPAYRDAGPEDVKKAWLEDLGSAAWLAEMMIGMRWGFLFSEAPVFITTDNPVAVVHPSLEFRGLKNPESVLYFPLSPTRVLFMDNRLNEPDCQYYPATDPASLNGILWRNSIEHMFCHRSPDLVCEEMLHSAHAMGFAA